jgi:integrase
MARPKKAFSKTVEEMGVKVRIFEREPGGALQLEIRDAGHASGKKRVSLNCTDRAIAEQRARGIARELAQLRYAGQLGPVTLGQVFGLYMAHKFPLLSVQSQDMAAMREALFRAHWGDGVLVDDITQTHVDSFAKARRSGKLRAVKRRGGAGVEDGTISHDFQWLASVFNWGRRHRVNGKRLLTDNPLIGLKIPRQLNPKQPVSSHERYTRTQDHTDKADPTGRLRCMLALARYTGRRVNAICNLSASDVLRSPDAVTRALAATGRDLRLANSMPDGAIRWRAENDKMGFDEITALSAPARAALDAYLSANPRVGEAPLFPADKDDSRSVTMNHAVRLLSRAEAAAELPKQAWGVWHPYRRLWASERKDLPDADVAAAGGWRDTRALKRHYQHSDPATLLRVVRHGTG